MTGRLSQDIDQHGEWGSEENAWDPETAEVGIQLFANAVQVWSMFQRRPVTVFMAAEAFNCAPARIREAVEHHYWMFLKSDLIEHEGE
ncbi:hypothetical protein [Fodinicurvata sediminis]|uniref:hypothetical protein n=1 Tax=Fodinicurvata sediminis TaxID=1121832 RepID=UPI0003B5BEFF|nr:hypothetical protein [Fodinicurvata sediminis]